MDIKFTKKLKLLLEFTKGYIMKKNTIYILFSIIFVWLLLLTIRGNGYVMSSGNSGYLVDTRTGEAWYLLMGRPKQKIEEQE